ncbi:hypothetical protein HYY72_03665 [Candidatus Woesearchaeota archaeon]|nr:hypothetical protein [Candidatus Woesearchaeota archaeon]
MSNEEYLSRWTYNYIKYKDAILKRIISIERKESGFLAVYKDRRVSYEIMASLKDFSNAANESTIVTFNTIENFHLMLNEWKKLVEKKLTIVLINPLSKLDEKWTVATHVHDSVCDKGSIKRGLKTMFESVEPLSNEQIGQICRAGP